MFRGKPGVLTREEYVCPQKENASLSYVSPVSQGEPQKTNIRKVNLKINYNSFRTYE